MAVQGGGAGGGPGTAGLGLAIQSIPASLISLAINSAAEFLYMILATADVTKTITKMGVWLLQAGLTTGTGVNGLGIYSEAGSQLGITGDMTTQFETLGTPRGRWAAASRSPPARTTTCASCTTSPARSPSPPGSTPRR